MEDKKKRPAGSSFWQITFPIILAAILVVLLAVWIPSTSSSGALSRFAEISTVLLVIPFFVAALVFGVVLVGLIYLVLAMMKWVPQGSGPILDALQKVRDAAGKFSGISARVVIEPAAFLAGIRRKTGPADREISISD